MTSPEVVEVIQQQADMTMKDKSVPLASDLQGATWLFRTGKVGLSWAGRFRSNELANVPFEARMVRDAEGEGRRRSTATARTPPACRLARRTWTQAYKFAMYFGGPDAASEYLVTGATNPVRTDLLDSADVQEVDQAVRAR